MKKLKNLLLIVLMLFCLTGCKDLFTYKNPDVSYLTGKHYVEMKFKNYGTIELELDADEAPITVTNFVNLVNSGFYDDNRIHRVSQNFVIQGGEDYGDVASTIKGEFDANGKSNNISHKRGTISMARTGDASSGFDTASSQFFIMLEDNESLDHYYAAFGHVTKGMDIVDKMAKKDYTVDYLGMIQDDSQMPVIEYAKVIEK